MSRSIVAGIGLAVLLSMIAVRPVLADESTAAFLATIQRANATLDQMQALFARIDQRHKDQAAAATTTPPPKPDQSP
jgi:hypothetical protein